MLVAEVEKERREKRKSSRSFGIRPGRVLASVILICALGLILTGRYHAIDRMGYEKAALKTRLEELERDRQALSLEIARLESLSRIEGLATGQLGMVRPARTASLRPIVAESIEGPDETTGVEVLSFTSAHSDPGDNWWDTNQWLERLFSRAARAGSRP